MHGKLSKLKRSLVFFLRILKFTRIFFIDWTPFLFHNAGSASAKQTKKLLYIKDALAKYQSGMSSGQSIDPVSLYVFTKVRASMQRGYFILNKALVPVTKSCEASKYYYSYMYIYVPHALQMQCTRKLNFVYFYLLIVNTRTIGIFSMLIED